MSLVELAIDDLRCIERAELELHPGINLIWGGNGSGKTSLLEGIFLLGRGRSFRTRSSERLIRHGRSRLVVFGRTGWVGAEPGGLESGVRGGAIGSGSSGFEAGSRGVAPAGPSVSETAGRDVATAGLSSSETGGRGANGSGSGGFESAGRDVAAGGPSSSEASGSGLASSGSGGFESPGRDVAAGGPISPEAGDRGASGSGSDGFGPRSREVAATGASSSEISGLGVGGFEPSGPEVAASGASSSGPGGRGADSRRVAAPGASSSPPAGRDVLGSGSGSLRPDGRRVTRSDSPGLQLGSREPSWPGSQDLEPSGFGVADGGAAPAGRASALHSFEPGWDHPGEPVLLSDRSDRGPRGVSPPEPWQSAFEPEVGAGAGATAQSLRAGAIQSSDRGLPGQRRPGQALGVQVSRTDGTTARINGSNAKSLTELTQVFPVQVIDPGIHKLVEEAGHRRRRWMDWAVFHVEHQFGDWWLRYTRALKQRNAALRTQPTQAGVWDSELIRLGELIAAARGRFVEALQPYWKESVLALSGLEPELHYFKGWAQEASLAEALAASRARDESKRVTHPGPHRADVIIRMNGRPAREVLSRGQQKLVAVAMTLAQLHLVKAATQATPTLLLDDPAAELDGDHLKRFIDQVLRLESQLILTSLQPESHLFGKPDRVFHVEHGRVKPA